MLGILMVCQSNVVQLFENTILARCILCVYTIFLVTLAQSAGGNNQILKFFLQIVTKYNAIPKCVEIWTFFGFVWFGGVYYRYRTLASVARLFCLSDRRGIPRGGGCGAVGPFLNGHCSSKSTLARNLNCNHNMKPNCIIISRSGEKIRPKKPQ